MSDVIFMVSGRGYLVGGLEHGCYVSIYWE